MSSIIKVGKVQSSTGQDAVTIANDGTITANGAIDSLKTDTISEKTSANGVSIDGLKIKDYQLMYGSNVGLSIDSNGTAYHPNPIWVRASSDTTVFSTDSAVLPFSEKTYGSTLGKAAFNTSTYKFTAPVAGAYLSTLSGMTLDDGQKNAELLQYINGSEIQPRVYTSSHQDRGTTGSAHNYFTNTQIIQLSANDVLHWSTSSLNIYMLRTYTGWFIYFLG